MKKFLNISFIFRFFGWLLLAILVIYIFFIIFYNVFASAQVVYNPFSVEYNNKTYIEFEPKFPYELIYDDSFKSTKERTYVKNIIVPLIYFEPYSVLFDKNNDFINLYYFDKKLVKEDFIYPTLDKNIVIEVWMSLSSEYKIIKDKKTVEKVVKSAKSNGKIKLDKEIAEYIKEHSYDNHCFYLRYDNCPIVEEFHIERTDDGGYIIQQYTLEEYNTIYWEDEAHQ